MLFTLLKSIPGQHAVNSSNGLLSQEKHCQRDDSEQQVAGAWHRTHPCYHSLCFGPQLYGQTVDCWPVHVQSCWSCCPCNNAYVCAVHKVKTVSNMLHICCLRQKTFCLNLRACFFYTLLFSLISPCSQVFFLLSSPHNTLLKSWQQTAHDQNFSVKWSARQK